MSEQPAETAPAHQVEADGWCWTCSRVPCRGDAITRRPPSAQQAQLARIEAKLNRIMRHLGIEVD